ncbi:MAG: hypothetical protein C0626_07610 [Arcobacter sp.]|nr:MAG: hypothetical protein C0626_07610 [Arcobacter sp.]
MHKIIIYLLLITSFLYSNSLNNPKRILILHSYHKSMNWVNNIEQAIYDTLKPIENNYLIHTEYMDTKRIFSQSYLNTLKKTYYLKYKDIKFDLILSSDNNAFDFLRKNRDDIFGDVPVSFSGVNNFKDFSLNGLTNFTGAVEIIDAKLTIKAALKIFPKTETIYIINDYLTTGKAWTQTMKRQLKDFKVNLQFAPNSSLSELQEDLKKLSKNTLVLLGVYFKDKDGTYVTYEKIGNLITKSSNAPTFCLLKFNLKGDVLGGDLISGYQQGKLQSEIGKMILDGVSASDIPIKKKGITSFIFDYKSLKKKDISLDLLPENSLIINRPVTFYEKHKMIIQVTSIVILVLLMIILFLLYTIKQKKKVEKELLKSKNELNNVNNQLEEKVKERTILLENAYEDITQYKYLFEQNRAVMLLIDPKNGKIVDVNKAAIDFYGFSRKELLSMKINDINILSNNEIQNEIEMANQEKRNHFYFEHRLKNNTIKSVEVLSGPITLGKKQLLYSIIHDITEHKEHENIINEQAKLASMGQMIGNIAHQWRQPLSVISSASTGMKLQFECGLFEQKDLVSFCDCINDNAQYLSKTINDFTNFIKNQDAPLAFNLKDCIVNFLHLLEGSLKKYDIKIILNNEVDITVNGYQNQLVQCLINIVNNAKDALRDNNIEKKYIFISTNIIDNNVEIIIRDNANGIPKQIITKVFEPYFTTKHQSQGTGLGLHITHDLITSMHGTVIVRNVKYKYNDEEYNGAEFKTTLPISINEM